MISLVPLAKKASALYGGGKAIILTVVAIGLAYGWVSTRASKADVDVVRVEQAENFRKLDRWAVRHFGDSFLDEPDVRTTSNGARGGRP